ncbi:MAG: hypothetical protein ACRDHE_02595 [Ktedonobacterales bacterium]
MSRDDWEQAIARAVVERAFRARLLTDPADALSDYGLPARDAHIVTGASAASLPEFVAHVLRLTGRIWDLGFDAAL